MPSAQTQAKRLEALAQWNTFGNQGAVLNVTAGENSHVTLYTHLKGQDNDTMALRLLLSLGKNASVRLVELLEPGENGTLLHDLGGNLGENAKIEVLHLYLGSGDIYSGCRMDLAGDNADFTYQAGYLGRNSQVLGCEPDRQPSGEEHHLQPPGGRHLKGQQPRRPSEAPLTSRRAAKALWARSRRMCCCWARILSTRPFR